MEIKKFLRFDMKSDRSRRLVEDRFALPPPRGTGSLRTAKNHMSRKFTWQLKSNCFLVRQDVSLFSTWLVSQINLGLKFLDGG